MGFMKRWDVADIQRQINAAAAYCKHPGSDGYSAWGTKQDLYQIKWLIDAAILSCPEFESENEWIRTQAKKQTWNTIKDSK